jgi:Ca2+-binding RTX toxin-like protein
VNEIDASGNADGYSLDLNLANNSLKINNPNASPQQIEVTNFVNVIGTKSNDAIIGANKNSKLTGGGGNDTITGGTKNDRLTGTDPTARGVGEVDTLTGGGGKDKFVLGDKNGAYYVGKGSNDYALINDFNIFNDSLDLVKLKDYSFGLEGNNTINLFSGKDANTRDLIAKIKIADAGNLISKGSSLSSKSSSILGESNLNIDAIVAKLDILSGSNSTDFS